MEVNELHALHLHHFFSSKNTSFSFYSSMFRSKYLQPLPGVISSCSKYLYHMGEQWEWESLQTQSISCSGCCILNLPEKEHCHSHHPLHLHFHLNKKWDFSSQSWWEEMVEIDENSLHVQQEKVSQVRHPAVVLLIGMQSQHFSKWWYWRN